eukprot:1856323-Rhodomonas_salina.1
MDGGEAQTRPMPRDELKRRLQTATDNLKRRLQARAAAADGADRPSPGRGPPPTTLKRNQARASITTIPICSE